MASRFKLSDGLLGALRGENTGPTAPGEMPFFDHLEELRWRIIWSLVAFVLMGGVGIFLSIRYDLVAVLINPARPYLCSPEKAVAAATAAAAAAGHAAQVLPCDSRMAILNLSDPMFIQIKLGLLLGLLLSFPVIAYEAWAFLSPALHQKEKRVLIPALYAGLVLFVLGALLAYFYVLPSTAKIMMSFMTPDMRQNIVVSDYIDLVTKLMVAFGLVFELPIVVLILSSLGLVTSKFLKDKRRFAIALMAIGASLMTPGDAISATLYMMLPLLFLYEVSIWLAKLMEKRRAKTLAELQEDDDDADAVTVPNDDASDDTAVTPDREAW